jgi:hypothetical protein
MVRSFPLFGLLAAVGIGLIGSPDRKTPESPDPTKEPRTLVTEPILLSKLVSKLKPRGWVLVNPPFQRSELCVVGEQAGGQIRPITQPATVEFCWICSPGEIDVSPKKATRIQLGFSFQHSRTLTLALKNNTTLRIQALTEPPRQVPSEHAQDTIDQTISPQQNVKSKILWVYQRIDVYSAGKKVKAFYTPEIRLVEFRKR